MDAKIINVVNKQLLNKSFFLYWVALLYDPMLFIEVSLS